MSADTVWVLTSTAMVLLMVPGLSLFYRGMVRSKNVLNMINMSIYCLGVVPLVWAVVGYTLSVGGGAEDAHSWFGFLNFENVWMNGVPTQTGSGEMATWAFWYGLRSDHASVDLWSHS